MGAVQTGPGLLACMHVGATILLRCCWCPHARAYGQITTQTDTMQLVR